MPHEPSSNAVPRFYAQICHRTSICLRTCPALTLIAGFSVVCLLILAWLSIPLRLPSVAKEDPQCDRMNYWLFFMGFFATYTFSTAIQSSAWWNTLFPQHFPRGFGDHAKFVAVAQPLAYIIPTVTYFLPRHILVPLIQSKIWCPVITGLTLGPALGKQEGEMKKLWLIQEMGGGTKKDRKGKGKKKKSVKKEERPVSGIDSKVDAEETLFRGEDSGTVVFPEGKKVEGPDLTKDQEMLDESGGSMSRSGTRSMSQADPLRGFMGEQTLQRPSGGLGRADQTLQKGQLGVGRGSIADSRLHGEQNGIARASVADQTLQRAQTVGGNNPKLLEEVGEDEGEETSSPKKEKVGKGKPTDSGGRSTNLSSSKRHHGGSHRNLVAAGLLEDPKFKPQPPVIPVVTETVALHQWEDEMLNNVAVAPQAWHTIAKFAAMTMPLSYYAGQIFSWQFMQSSHKNAFADIGKFHVD
ncbi:hypothetical protein HDV00_004792 [Rhizophlyctis rosea]|nr:hypothetical protein HDV00_004792 [Rhizophlyctis rosea]